MTSQPINLHLLCIDRSEILYDSLTRRFDEESRRTSYLGTIWFWYADLASTNRSYGLILIGSNESVKPTRLNHSIIIYKGDNISRGSCYPFIASLRHVIALSTQTNIKYLWEFCYY